MIFAAAMKMLSNGYKVKRSKWSRKMWIRPQGDNHLLQMSDGSQFKPAFDTLTSDDWVWSEDGETWYSGCNSEGYFEQDEVIWLQYAVIDQIEKCLEQDWSEHGELAEIRKRNSLDSLFKAAKKLDLDPTEIVNNFKRKKMSMFVYGGTGCGKTTLLNKLVGISTREWNGNETALDQVEDIQRTIEEAKQLLNGPSAAIDVEIPYQPKRSELRIKTHRSPRPRTRMQRAWLFK